VTNRALTADDVLRIRRLRAEGKSLPTIAKEYTILRGRVIAPQYIRQITTGQIWRSAGGPITAGATRVALTAPPNAPGVQPVRAGGDARAGNRVFPWYWEGNVQAQVARFLIAEGWAIESAADTASRQRGIDLVATKGDRRLAVEVKGYPETVYARGEKAGLPKPTPPGLQARHWLAHAILTAVTTRNADNQIEIARAFPDLPRYRDLLGEIEYAIDRLELRVFLSDESGRVTELYKLTG
jgi:hypothetical protein